MPGRAATSAAGRPSVRTRVVCRVTADGALDCRTEGPVHTVPVPVREGPPGLVLVRDAAGLAAGDCCRTRVVVQPHGAVVLSDSGPTHLLAAAGEAVGYQEVVLDIGADGLAVLAPHAVVPFAGSRSRLVTRASVHPSATLVVAGVLAPGRVAREELWAPDLLEQVSRLCCEGVPLVHDALRVGPLPPAPVGHLVTVLAHRRQVGRRVDGLRAQLGEGAAVSALTDSVVAVRGLAETAQQAQDLVRRSVVALLPELSRWPWHAVGHPRDNGISPTNGRAPLGAGA